MNRRWDEEHDRYVLGCLLDLVEEFEPATLQAFRRLAPSLSESFVNRFPLHGHPG
jgi:hypothetical protein